MRIKQGGTWRWSHLRVKWGGLWKTPQRILTKVNGVWQGIQHLLSVMNGLTRWWLSESKAVDPISGTSLTVSSGATFAAVLGRMSLRIYGGRYALVPNVSLSGNWSINLWYYPLGYETYSHLLTHVGGQVNFALKLTVGDGRPYLHYKGVSYGLSSAGLPLNQWSMVTVTHEAGVLKIYLNKVLQTTANVTVSQAAVNMYVGRGHEVEYSNGYQRDLLFYNRALSQAEIDTIYQEQA